MGNTGCCITRRGYTWQPSSTSASNTRSLGWCFKRRLSSIHESQQCWRRSSNGATIWANGRWPIRLWSALQRRNNEHYVVSNHRRILSQFSRLLRLTSKKTWKPALLALCEMDPPVTVGFPSQSASYAESISITLRHNGNKFSSIDPLSGESIAHRCPPPPYWRKYRVASDLRRHNTHVTSR